jgi:hypothetical protein
MRKRPVRFPRRPRGRTVHEEFLAAASTFITDKADTDQLFFVVFNSICDGIIDAVEGDPLTVSVDTHAYDPATEFAPSFDMTISTARYRRDPQTTKDIASGDLVREQWESDCRVR